MSSTFLQKAYNACTDERFSTGNDLNDRKKDVDAERVISSQIWYASETEICFTILGSLEKTMYL
jgi:hypothetical protein